MIRLVIATLLVFLAATLFAGERKLTYYPGTCPDGQSWYMVESDSTSFTVGCMDPDYQPDDNDQPAATD